MSGQMSDVIVIGNDEWAIVEPAAGEIFDVRANGLMPVSMHSANTRGELARFRLDDGGQLFLSDLQVGSLDAPPAINGIEPTTDDYGQVWTYLQLDLPIAWTGDLIAGADPILDLYVHAGFLPVWHYAQVLAFDIEAGLVQSREDRSAAVEQFRAERASGTDDDDGIFERFLDAMKVRISNVVDGDPTT